MSGSRDSCRTFRNSFLFKKFTAHACLRHRLVYVVVRMLRVAFIFVA